MSALAYAIATAAPRDLLAVGFVLGVLTLTGVSVVVDAIRGRRHG